MEERKGKRASFLPGRYGEKRNASGLGRGKKKEEIFCAYRRTPRSRGKGRGGGPYSLGRQGKGGGGGGRRECWFFLQDFNLTLNGGGKGGKKVNVIFVPRRTLGKGGGYNFMLIGGKGKSSTLTTR